MRLVCITSRLQRNQEFSIPEFPGRDFAKSWDPGTVEDGISLKFFPGILQKSVGSLGISLSSHKFGQFHTFWRTFLFVKYIRQTRVSSIPYCDKQQEREGVQCCWHRGDPKKSLPHTRERRRLCYCVIVTLLQQLKVSKQVVMVIERDWKPLIQLFKGFWKSRKIPGSRDMPESRRGLITSHHTSVISQLPPWPRVLQTW